jgi:NAD(P)-dependent dehydrogenase (short-subunit alcohol dehydrogenase family)
MSNSDKRVAVVTIFTILTSRDENKGKAAVEALSEEGGELISHQLDITDLESVNRLSSFVSKEYGQCDILVNNAGVFLDRGKSIFEVPVEIIQDTLEINAFGALNMCRALLPLMKKHDYGRIVNVSSGMGMISTLSGYSSAYRLSKVLLNAMTRIMADEVKEKNIKVNTMDPGWVRTDMGGPSAPRSPAQGADTVVWLANLPADGPTGGFFGDRQPIPW